MDAVCFELNGQKVSYDGNASARLLDVLRDTYGCKSVKCGCKEGECGACSVLKTDPLLPWRESVTRNGLPFWIKHLENCQPYNADSVFRAWFWQQMHCLYKIRIPMKVRSGKDYPATSVVARDITRSSKRLHWRQRRGTDYGKIHTRNTGRSPEDPKQ